MARASESAVSSVIGTVLMLGITTAVFGGFAIVALGYVQDQPHAPRADLAMVQESGSLYIQHKGGESFSARDGTLYVNVAGSQVTHALSDAAFDALGTSWRVGSLVCVQGNAPGCLYPASADVRGAFLVDENALLTEVGERGSTGPVTPPTFPDLTVSLLSQSPPAPGVGQGITWTVRIANGGLAPTAAVPLAVQVEVNSVVVATATATGPLADGATLDATSTPAWTGTLGTHTLRLTVDAAGLIAESNEGNNVATSSFTVAVGTPDPGQAFIDTNNDGLYTSGTDSLIPNSQVTDCNYNAGGNGLVLPPSVGAITAASCDFEAGGDLYLAVSLTATSGTLNLEGDDVTVAPGVTLNAQGSLTIVPHEDFVGDGATFLTQGVLRIGSSSPGQLGVTASLVGAALDNTGGNSAIYVEVDSGAIDLSGATFDSKGAIHVGGANNGHQASAITFTGADLDNTGGNSGIHFAYVSGPITGTGSGTRLSSKGAIDLPAGTALDIQGARLDNTGGNSGISLSAGTTLNAAGTDIDSKGAITAAASGAMTWTNAVLDNSGGNSGITLSTSSTMTATSVVIDSKGPIDLISTGAADWTGANLDNSGGNAALTVTSSAGSIAAGSLTADSKGVVTFTAATSLTLTSADVDSSGGGNTATFTATAGALACNPCTLRSGQTMTLTGASVTATGATLQSTSNALTVTSTNGALSAASVVAQSASSQTWKASNAGIVLNGATLQASGSTLTACLATSTGQISLSGTLSFIDSNNKLNVQRDSGCGTDARNSTYVTPWNGTTQAATE